jgi:hypothetical protein
VIIKKSFYILGVRLCVSFFIFSIAHTQDTSYYFYRPLNYGSEAMFNPIAVLMNGGLDVLQSYSSSNRVNGVEWGIGATSVWRNVTSPAYYISRYGWKKFLMQEVIPTSLDIARAQWVPNYTLHLIGGGMEYRKLSEWYDYHGYPVPFVFGAATTMGYHFINEVVENGTMIRGNTDAIADFCIFDPLGILLFSFDGVAQYFSSTFGMNDWSPQPSFSFNPLSFRNFGHSFVMRYPVTESKRTSAFLYLGKSTLIGVSLKTDVENSISFGAGGTQTGVWEVESTNGIGTYSIHVGAACGVFYDRNNSLLASLLISEYYLERVRLNIYPGVICSSYLSPGFFFTLGGRGTYAVGITMQIVPFGIGMYAPH